MSVTQPLAPRRYLDHAATSWPKPEIVFGAWEQAARTVGAAAGRGGYREAIQADAICESARSRVAALLGGVDPSRVAFPAGATLALNMAIHGLLKPGDHVLAMASDHNATLRPLHWLSTRGIIETTIVPCDGVGRVDPDAVANAWRPSTKLIVCSHASNVTGVLQEAEALAAIAHQRGGLLLLDAAQTLGQISFMPRGLGESAFGADVVAAPSHKWLQGMAGAGIFWVRPGIDVELLVQGGTGTSSNSLEMPDSFLQRMQPGTPDVPALAGLSAAVDWLDSQTIEAIAAQGRTLAQGCASQLREIPGVRVIGPRDIAVPIVSFTVEGYDPSEIAALLEQLAGVQVRSGFHCAALVHDHIGTQSGGTVRVSFGPFNSADDADAVAEVIATLVSTTSR